LFGAVALLVLDSVQGYYFAAAATILTVSSTAGFEVGDAIRVSGRFNQEEAAIVQIGPGFGEMVVRPQMENLYVPGNFVQHIEFFSAAGQDPLVTFGDQSREFWLPVGKLTPIMHTRHMNILASTFAGSPYEQWIDRIVVTNVDGLRLVEIAIKKDIYSYNKSEAKLSLRNGFETMDVSVGMDASPMKEFPEDLPNGNKKWFRRLNFPVWVVCDKLQKVFNYLPWHVSQFHIGNAQREAVTITSPDARFVIVSSPATEYYGAFKHLSVQYAHLDIHILNLKKRASIRGILPEIMGIQKLSNRTKELTRPPWSTTDATCDSNEQDKQKYSPKQPPITV